MRYSGERVWGVDSGERVWGVIVGKGNGCVSGERVSGV